MPLIPSHLKPRPDSVTLHFSSFFLNSLFSLALFFYSPPPPSVSHPRTLSPKPLGVYSYSLSSMRSWFSILLFWTSHFQNPCIFPPLTSLHPRLPWSIFSKWLMPFVFLPLLKWIMQKRKKKKRIKKVLKPVLTSGVPSSNHLLNHQEGIRANALPFHSPVFSQSCFS